ncbi:cupin domain-containing protein [Bradyrhizobium elkanii]|uniref:cupin domain-containing protein n=1 Tax=Bradyrhizobium elkanii TaxID=29448 RepID=UPI003D234E79
MMLRAAIVFALTASAHVALAEEAPKDNQGYTTPKTVVIDLGKEIPNLAGWQLRLRVLNIAPGGHIGLHSHKDRPAVVYFHQGTDTVTNEDGKSNTFHPGDTTAEGVNTVHWHKNTGNDAVVIYTADLIKVPAK